MSHEALSRRGLLSSAALSLLGVSCGKLRTTVTTTQPLVAGSNPWELARSSFLLDGSYVHLNGLLLASHPKPVRDTIDRYRQELDRNPTLVWEENLDCGEDRVRAAAAAYLGCQETEIALTDSTTMGIGLLFGGLQLRPDDEVLTTTHDHFSTVQSLDYLHRRTGAVLRRVSLYEDSRQASVETMVSALQKGVTPACRVVAITWVHSGTGVKTPVAEIAEMLRQVNRRRSVEEQIVLCVDGVHGLGVERESLPELGCDFFVAGTHKWLFGPRGTGVLWGRTGVCERVLPIIPTFSTFTGRQDWGRRLTPGGFHSFEHRWALAEAFDWHRRLGKAAVTQRIHSLCTLLKEALNALPGVRVQTPQAAELSAGMVCFEVKGMTPQKVVEKLLEKRIVASTTPYAVSYPRLSPGIYNNESEIMAAVRAIAALRSV